MSTTITPEYSNTEEVTVLQTEAEALKELGATTFVSSATGFGLAPIQQVRYSLLEERAETKANILGE
jgi:hypothetical protein